MDTGTVPASTVEPAASRPRTRDIGLEVGILPVGPLNAITDVEGVWVGHRTLRQGDAVRTGVTVIRPHPGNVFRRKVPAAVHCGNAFGKLAGSTQVDELGTLETPIALTSTLSVGTALRALVRWTLEQPGNEDVGSVNAVVGETNDGFLHDVRGQHVQEEDVLTALAAAAGGPVAEGSVGAGTGTSCFGFKGGIGTASRRLPPGLGGHTLGVLVQTNYGGVLTVNGAPVGRELGAHFLSERCAARPADPAGGPACEACGVQRAEGSCMIVVATDAPLGARALGRLARRGVLGLARTGSFMGHGSGDYVVAFSTVCRRDPQPLPELPDEALDPLFLAVVEGTEEAVYNSLLRATAVTGRGGHVRQAIRVDRVVEICRRYGVLDLQRRLPGVSSG